MTSNAKADGRFGKQDFRYLVDRDLYICPAGERLTHRFTSEEHGLILRRYWTNACQTRPCSRASILAAGACLSCRQYRRRDCACCSLATFMSASTGASSDVSAAKGYDMVGPPIATRMPVGRVRPSRQATPGREVAGRRGWCE